MREGRLLNEQAQVQEAGMFTWDKIFLDWISHIDNHLGDVPRVLRTHVNANH